MKFVINSILNNISRIIITVRYFICYLYAIVQWKLFLRKVDGFKQTTINNYRNYLRKKGMDYSDEVISNFYSGFVKEHILKTAESLTFFSASDRELNSLETEFRNEEIIKEKLAEGKGVILIIPHIGPYNLLPACIFFDLGIEAHFLTLAPEYRNFKRSKEKKKVTGRG